jgi:hypothetical protein
MSVFNIYIPNSGNDISWGHCTKQWQNLVIDLQSKYPDWMYREDTYELINQELQNYHGQLDKVGNGVRKIIFEGEENKTWFILRWS